MASPSAFDCPRCRKPMESGFVTAGKGLKFRKDGRFHLTIFGGDPIISMWRSSGTPAWKCTACRLVLVDYGPGPEVYRAAGVSDYYGGYGAGSPPRS